MTIVLLTVILSIVTPFISLAQSGGDPRKPLHPSMVWHPRCVRCYPLCFDSKAGIAYGILQNTFGVKVYDYRPWMLGVPLFLITDIEWRRSGNGNSYFDIAFIRDFSSVTRNFTLSPEIGYKRIGFNKTQRVNQFRGGINLSYKRIELMLGYSHQWEPQSDASVASESGIMVKVHREFFLHLEVNASVTYWFDEFQYSVKIKEDLFCTGIILGIGLERVGNWNELDVSVLYRYH